MNVRQLDVTIRDLVAGYLNNEAEGVVAYGGRLDVRPKYQREFIYKPEQQEAVIDTVTNGYPLNVMYWAVREGGETYEVIDGQQRTLSICEYVTGKFAYKFRYFSNLTGDEQKKILSYPLMVYLCDGSDSEKLQWFKTINIAGEELTEQELLNAVYAGPWTGDMKRYFSRPSGPAYGLGNRYLKGEPIRQDYLATVLKWKSEGAVKDYMAKRQHEASAMEEWLYFKSIIDWIETLFPRYRKEMKGLDWGILHRRYSRMKYDPSGMEEEITELMADPEVQRKGGIYEFLLGGRTDQSLLNLRKFDETDKRTVYEGQSRKCAICGEVFEFSEMDGDHIVPWAKGGRTKIENLQMLCRICNLKKGSR